jgi:hypothetical protein
MSDTKKKLVVVLLAALVFLPLIAWRSWQALVEELPGSTADFEKWVKEERVAEAPAWYRLRERLTSYEREPETPHLRLATLRFPQLIEQVQKAKDNRQTFPPLYKRAIAMGGNAFVNEQIDENAPGLPANFAELVQTVYLLHAGPVPASLLDGGVEPVTCQVTGTMPGKPAEATGMKGGDDFVKIGEHEVFGKQCHEVLGLLRAPPGTKLQLVMLRNGALVDLELVKEGDINGFHYMSVPVLSDPAP